jgi:hypothetical protein
MNAIEVKFCTKCGAITNSNDAVHCLFCQAPLKKLAKITQHARQPSTINKGVNYLSVLKTFNPVNRESKYTEQVERDRCKVTDTSHEAPGYFPLKRSKRANFTNFTLPTTTKPHLPDIRTDSSPLDIAESPFKLSSNGADKPKSPKAIGRALSNMVLTNSDVSTRVLGNRSISTISLNIDSSSTRNPSIISPQPTSDTGTAHDADPTVWTRSNQFAINQFTASESFLSSHYASNLLFNPGQYLYNFSITRPLFL